VQKKGEALSWVIIGILLIPYLWPPTTCQQYAGGGGAHVFCQQSSGPRVGTCQDKGQNADLLPSIRRPELDRTDHNTTIAIYRIAFV
jgi:hypothetical protein